MTNSPKPPVDRRAGTTLVAISGGIGAGEAVRSAPRPPGYLSLRRAAEMVEGAAYDLAGQESPVFISRLIEIAAELDRHARTAPGLAGREAVRVD
ncbi:MAG: hypothetical protein MUE98_13425 [Rhodobacteraceae bacterium]|jgi:hypothetical protein|nr:hypothetical protein [Paracoccaceae bacterium]